MILDAEGKELIRRIGFLGGMRRVGSEKHALVDCVSYREVHSEPTEGVEECRLPYNVESKYVPHEFARAETS